MVTFILSNNKAYRSSLDIIDFLKLVNSKDKFILFDLEEDYNNGNYYRCDEIINKSAYINTHHIIEINF